MQLYTSRAGRRPVARTVIVIAAAVALGACADETTAPTPATAPRAVANTLVPAPSPYTTTVNLQVVGATFSPTGGTVVQLSIACSTTEVLDLAFGLMQERNDRRSKMTLEGMTTITDITCTPTATSYAVRVEPFYGTEQFQPGRATAYGRVLGQPAWVEPAEVSRRVRIADLTDSPL
jgi:hypothetical protein